MSNIVFLIANYYPHQLNTINEIANNSNCVIYSYSISEKYAFIPTGNKNHVVGHSVEYGKKKLLARIIELEPILLVTAGWMIPKYMWVCKRIKSCMNIPVVAMTDTQWYGTWKQRVNALISPFHVRKAFTHLWVSGIRQYEYARRLGFGHDAIIFNSLCGNTKLFSKVEIESKQHFYPKNFLYIGRLEEGKGIRNLLNAWSQIRNKMGWTFTLVGDGSMWDELKKSNQFILRGNRTQEELVGEFQNSGCFVLPSLHEQWSLVIHEAAISGLPIVCTETCGAAPHFLINRFNGLLLKDNSISDLTDKLITIMSKTPQELIEMSENSRKLSHRITPEIHRASLMQLIE